MKAGIAGVGVRVSGILKRMGKVMEKSWRRKISILLLIMLAVVLIPTVFFILASLMVSSVRLPENLSAPPQVIGYLVDPNPAGVATSRTATGQTSSAQSVTSNRAPASAPVPPPPPVPSDPTPGGRIWLAMIRENSALFAAGIDSFNRDFDAVFPEDFPPPTLTRERIRWLQGKAPLIAQLLRLAEAGNIDYYNDPRLLRLREPELSTYANARRFSESFLQLLGLHALWRRQEKDYAGAGRSLLAALRLSAMLELNSATNTDYPYFPAVERYLHEAVRDSRWPVDQFQALLEELTRIESWRFPRHGITRYFVKLYFNERGLIVQQMNQPTWKNPIYGYDVNTRMPDYWGPLRIGKYEFGIELPRPHRILATSLTAMRNKTRAAESLRQYDEAWRQLLEASRKPYSEWRTERSRLMTQIKLHGNYLLSNRLGLGGQMISLQYYDFTTSIRVRQAEVHLCRLGLMWRLDPKGTLALRKDINLSGNPQDPWRDPFTEKPMLLDNPTTPTLIYSLGPDLIDQLGAETLDASNPYRTKGDIVIRLPA